MTKITDVYELYSFIIYLYGYSFFYSYIFGLPLLKGAFLNISCNLLFNYTLNTNIFKFITHNYWIKHLNTIAMPQLISTVLNMIIINDGISTNHIITIPINIFLNHLISKMYNNELKSSKNIRYFIIFLFLFLETI